MNTSERDMQGTVQRDVEFAGRGLHTGRYSKITVRPAPADHGILFRQVDSRGVWAAFHADWRNIRDLPLCTCLTDGTRRQIRTIEHLMAAFYGCGIDNAVVEVRGGEIPLMDGSAKPFTDALAGLVTGQQKERRVVAIDKVIEVHDGPRWIRVEPTKP